jgi:hypothetical protein
MTSTLIINKKTMTMFAIVVAAAATCLGAAAVVIPMNDAYGFARGMPDPDEHTTNDGTANAFFHTKSNQPCSVYCNND